MKMRRKGGADNLATGEKTENRHRQLDCPTLAHGHTRLLGASFDPASMSPAKAGCPSIEGLVMPSKNSTIS